MYTDTLRDIGLSKNESRIYESLLKQGESSVGDISSDSGVHRRNVYDSLKRLVEKGLVFEVVERNERHYKAVRPEKLSELIEEKREALDSIMPELEDLYQTTPRTNEVYVYKGVEGVKNYMRDILRIGEDVFVIGGKAGWLEDRIASFSKQVLKESKKKGIKYHALFDQEVKETNPEVIEMADEHRFLPKEYSTPGVIDIFGDRVVVSSNAGGKFEEDISLTVIVNQQIADSFRVWFKFLWEMSEGK